MYPSFLLFCALLPLSHLFSWLPCSDFFPLKMDIFTLQRRISRKGCCSLIPVVSCDFIPAWGGCRALPPSWNSVRISGLSTVSVWWRIHREFILKWEQPEHTGAGKGWCPVSEFWVEFLEVQGRVRISFLISSLIVELWKRGRWFLWFCCVFFLSCFSFPSTLRFTTKLFSSFLLSLLSSLCSGVPQREP